MKFRLMLLSIVIACLSAAIQTLAAPSAAVSTGATYRGVTDADSDASGVLGTPAAAASYAEIAVEGGYADALAFSEIPGEVKAYAGGMGAYFGPISASASASQTIDWLATSTTLPVGTPVSIFLELSFTGTLEATYGESAAASASLALDGSPIYEGTATGGYQLPTSTGAWLGDFDQIATEEVLDPSWRSYYRNVFLLDTVDTVSFDTTVGQLQSLTLMLSADITSGGFESGAWADFYHSGSYAFIRAKDPQTGNLLDVQFHMVPEPSALTLASMICAVLLLRRQRSPSLWRANKGCRTSQMQ